MNKKILTVLMLCAAVTVSGCALPGKKAEKAAVTAAPTATAAPTPTASPAPTATPTPVPLKSIGDKEAGAYEVQLKNATGKAIKAFSVKLQENAEFPESLLKEEDIFTDGEERILYYKSDGNIQDPSKETVYEIRLTFDDDTERILHDFPFKDMEKGEICTEGDVVYLTYTSMSTKAPVSTKAAEIMAAATPEAVMQATPTEIPVIKENNSSSYTGGVQTDYNQDYEDVPSYDYPDDGYEDSGETDENDTGDDDRIYYDDTDDDRIYYDDTTEGDTADEGRETY